MTDRQALVAVVGTGVHMRRVVGERRRVMTAREQSVNAVRLRQVRMGSMGRKLST